MLWPDTAGALLVEPLTLRDLRDLEQDLDVPLGALSPRLPRNPPACRGRRCRLRWRLSRYDARAIDLHSHSNASDGTDAPAEVIRRAVRPGSTCWR